LLEFHSLVGAAGKNIHFSYDIAVLCILFSCLHLTTYILPLLASNLSRVFAKLLLWLASFAGVAGKSIHFSCDIAVLCILLGSALYFALTEPQEKSR